MSIKITLPVKQTTPSEGVVSVELKKIGYNMAVVHVPKQTLTRLQLFRLIGEMERIAGKL